MENGLTRVKINAKGHLTSIFDLRARREVLSEPGNVFHLHRDIPNYWDAWDVDIFYRERVRRHRGSRNTRTRRVGSAARRRARSFAPSASRALNRELF